MTRIKRTPHIAILTLCVALSSCALPDLRAYDAQQREVLARASHEAAEEIEEVVVNCALNVVEKVTKAVEVIQENTADQISRARIAQKDFNAKPQKLPEIRSPEDDVKVQAYAGLAESRETRRRIVKELPGKIGGGAAWIVKKLIPRWLLWTIGIVAFVSFGGLSWLVIVWRRARQGLREMILLANRPEVKDQYKGKTNGTVQKEYRKMGEKGLL